MNKSDGGELGILDWQKIFSVKGFAENDDWVKQTHAQCPQFYVIKEWRAKEWSLEAILRSDYLEIWGSCEIRINFNYPPNIQSRKRKTNRNCEYSTLIF